ncbi:MAG: C4-dicarboxylate ABC transporter, partial [Deltaproteobacteria bacterium]|nr:C4-dicarboxylate ABC transporter [Deltaproteobacteria bacterium]
MMEYLPLLMFLTLVVFLISGYPVAFVLPGVALVFGLLGFGLDFFTLLPMRIWGRMTNQT